MGAGTDLLKKCLKYEEISFESKSYCIDGLAQDCSNSSALAIYTYLALDGPELRAPKGSGKSNGARVGFKLRARWTPKIEELIMYHNGGASKFVGGL